MGLLAALPFNLHTQELMQTPETYVARAMELSEEGAFDKVQLKTAKGGWESQLRRLARVLPTVLHPYVSVKVAVDACNCTRIELHAFPYTAAPSSLV